MLRYFATLLVLTVIIGCGAILNLHHANAVVALGNPDPMTVGCATGFTRRLPNFCQRNVWGTNTTLSGTVCTLQDITGAGHGVPVAAKAAMLLLIKTIGASNAVATRSASTDIFSDSSCTTQQIRTNASIREMVAIAGGVTLLDTQGIHPVVPLFNGSFAYTNFFVNCANCSSTFNVIGYYD